MTRIVATLRGFVTRLVLLLAFAVAALMLF